MNSAGRGRIRGRLIMAFPELSLVPLALSGTVLAWQEDLSIRSCGTAFKITFRQLEQKKRRITGG